MNIIYIILYYILYYYYGIVTIIRGTSTFNHEEIRWSEMTLSDYAADKHRKQLAAETGQQAAEVQPIHLTWGYHL